MSITVREKKLKSGKKSLYLDIYHNGRRHYEFLKLYLTGDRSHDKEVRQLAESIKAKRQLEIQNSAHGFVPQFKQKSNFVKYFQKKADRFKEKGNGTYQSVLNYVIKFDGEEIPFSTINRRWVSEFKDYLGKQVSQSSARNYFTIFRAVLNKAVKDQIIASNPADTVDNFKKDDASIEWLTLDEIKKLMQTDIDRDHIKKAFLFSCFTGMRFSDIAKLRWDEIRENKIVFKQKKTNGSEYLPINKQARKFLPEKRGELVFDLMIVSSSDYWVKKLGKKAELSKDLHFHMGRHTFAVMALNNGVDIFTLKELLGHSSLSSTMTYAKVVNKTKEDAVDKLPEVEL